MDERAKKQKVIYSLRVMRDLLEMGFRPIETLENPIDERYKCWIFEKTAEFDAALDKVLGGRSDGRN